MSIKRTEHKDLLNQLIVLIENAKRQVVSHANSTLTVLFWHIGNQIINHKLKNKRGEYGKQIVVTLSRHLSWSHFLTLIPIKDQNARDFYGEMAYVNLFGVRELRKNIKHKVFERTENADLQLLESNRIEKGTFKDPYFLDFLELKDGYLENDLESAILKELELFILELGTGFTFVERQKRMIIDGDDHNLDLLFFHRKLKRLVAIELKIDKFKAKYKGQMELYLRWLDKYERQEGEQNPIGLILCAVASKEQIELLEMHKDGIMVAEYWTELPPKEILEAKLHEVFIEARERIARKQLYK